MSKFTGVLKSIDHENIPQFMRGLAQWVVWGKRSRVGEVCLTKDSKLDKRFFNPTNLKNGTFSWDDWKVAAALEKRDGSLNPYKGASNDARTWGIFESAWFAYQTGFWNGVGFVFSESDGLVGIDLDTHENWQKHGGRCFDENGNITNEAQEILGQFAGAYVEKSPSGNGLHIICQGAALETGSGLKNTWIEIYGNGINGHSHRYFCAGELVGVCPSLTKNHQRALSWLHNRFKVVEKPKIQEVHSVLPDKNGQFTKFINAVIDGETEKVSSAIDGNRNTALFNAAATLRTFENSPWATEYMPTNIESVLLSATSLPYDEAHKTIRSGIKRADDKGYTREAPKKSNENYATDTQGKSGKSRKTAEAKPKIETEIEPETIQRKATGLQKTDIGNAERLMLWHGKNIRYCVLDKMWYIWNGKQWLRDEKLKINDLAINTVRSILAEASDTSLGKDERDSLIKHSIGSENVTRVKALLTMSYSMAAIDLNEFDTNVMELNVQNGTVDLRMGKLVPHSQEKMHSKIGGVFYDEGATCPQWDIFMDWICTGNNELKLFIQKAVGYSLSGIVNEECIFLLHGDGANGKTTFINVISALMHEYYTLGAADLLIKQRQDRHLTELADLQGARFISVSETEKGRYLDENKVKVLTRSQVKARYMRKDHFTFPMYGKIWCDTNHLPNLKGTDHGIYRRTPMIVCQNKISLDEKDENLERKLITELPGILNWAIEGCLSWQRNGLLKTMPDIVTNATEEYHHEQDQYGRFIEEMCELGEEFTAATSFLYQSYKIWCDENGERAAPNSVFGKEIIKKDGLASKKGGKGKRYYLGIKLIDVTDNINYGGGRVAAGGGKNPSTLTRGNHEARQGSELPPCHPKTQNPNNDVGFQGDCPATPQNHPPHPKDVYGDTPKKKDVKSDDEFQLCDWHLAILNLITPTYNKWVNIRTALTRKYGTHLLDVGLRQLIDRGFVKHDTSTDKLTKTS